MKITIIGCGKMGSAIAKRLAPAHELFLYDHNTAIAEQCANQLHAAACDDIADALNGAELILIAVKPQNLHDLAHQMPRLAGNPLLISILAGVTYQTLKEYFPKNPILRMMPNLALSYGKGVFGLAENDALSAEHRSEIETIFRPLGPAHWIPEAQMDALTALTGSGPAFLMTIFESIIDAGIAMGFQPEESQHLAQELWRGVAAMIADSSKTPAQWKKEIASPGGATVAGLKVMEKCNIHDGMIQAFQATQQRAKELTTGS